METAGRWALLDARLPADVRADIEDRLWRPIEAQATLEVLRTDPAFIASPGTHPAMFADHGVVHVRDVATGLTQLVRTVDGVLLAARPPQRRAFVETIGVAMAYLHDIGMVDMTRVGRRVHPLVAAHAAFGPDATPLVEHLLGPGPVRERLDEVGRQAPFTVPREMVVREVLSLSAAHSKTTVPAWLLDDRGALRRRMQGAVFVSLDAHRAAAPEAVTLHPDWALAARAGYPDPSASFAWLEASDGPQAELADDVIDAIRALRAADVLRQRGTVLRTSGGFELCLDAETAQAVCTMRTANGDAAYVIMYDDPRGAGEANVQVAFVTPGGDLRIAFHRGAFGSEEATRRAMDAMAGVVIDIEADVLPSFAGRPARGLPPPLRSVGDMRIELERPDDRPAFADEVASIIIAREPALAGRVVTVANVEGAAPDERRRYHLATHVDPEGDDAVALLRRVAEHGLDDHALEPADAFAEVKVASIAAGERLVAPGSSPSFVYVPLGPGLTVRPDGGYAPSPLHPWVPVGTTGVIRRAERNSEIVADRDVDVLMIPAERYARAWLRPLSPEDLARRLLQEATASTG
ncbi:MAG TPA: hypothetical protein VGM28_08510 [Candidatus Limnocylindrales bacterium]|jgi:hypothetical protein